MQSRKVRYFAVLVVFAIMGLASFANAGPYTALVAYGDSLSDNGNLYAAIGYPPSPPYYNGRFSNGPVTVEQLASSFHAPLLDFGYGGATTGFGNTVDGGTQTTNRHAAGNAGSGRSHFQHDYTHCTHFAVSGLGRSKRFL